MSNNIDMYCISPDEKDLDLIEKLSYIPVGLGPSNFSNKWMRDNQGENISFKNKWYGELTFHFYFWKNILNKIPEKRWIGFCAYRDIWVNYKEYLDYKNDPKSYQIRNTNRYNEINSIAIKEPHESWNNYEVILGDEMYLENIKFMKLLKYGKLSLLRNPRAIFKSGRTIRWHFDMFHGNGIIDLASDLLEEDERYDFKEFININNSFNRGNMFICKSKIIMNKFYESLFPWLEKCEKKFGSNLEGYGKTRLYAFLTERYIPYWFKKHTKYLVWPALSFNIPRKNFT
tara:strand:+ start:520 stop:1380 length:861 start_codon:yes stop_codon:yes gene_type:complete